MEQNTGPTLAHLFAGWEGYNQSILSALAPLSAEQLAFRPAANLRSVGELARHIAFGRITWWARMNAPGGADLVGQIEHWESDGEGNRWVDEAAYAITTDGPALVLWLNRSWQMIERTLGEWHVADLDRSYRHIWGGDAYAIPMQWTIFRILAHDIHHGGELALMLGLQGMEPFELGAWGGHILLPPRAPD